jgi:hypothetical protein
MPENTLFSHLCSVGDAELFDQQSDLWKRADRVTIDRYWDGKAVLKEKGPEWRNLTQVASVWNHDTLYFYFHCWFDQLTVNPEWTTSSAIPGLWEKDVVEIFLRPESCDDYYEIEVSPLGQWLDIHILKPRVNADYRWESRLRLQVRVDQESRIWRVFVALPFIPLMQVYGDKQCPRVGDSWRLNLYRMTGEPPDREYLAWCPTFTGKPDFHVPSAFGNIIFLGE